MINLDAANFDPMILDKISRLLGVLAEIDRHPFLSNRICMHGGTAINLFMRSAPRLSTDADLTYIGSEEKEVAQEERPDVEKAIADIGSFLGYNVVSSGEETIGSKFVFRYQSPRGSDFIKIDINYLNRVPLLRPERLTCFLDSNVKFTTLSKAELVAGKTKALFDRVVVRDLYDIASLHDIMEEAFDLTNNNSLLQLRRTILFYATLSNLFPTEFSGLTQKRFANREKQIVDELYPVLHVSDRPSLSGMIEKVEAFVAEYVVPKDRAEKEYVNELASNKYRPELLFSDWPDMLEAAQKSPSAKWKLINLEKRDLSISREDRVR